MRAHTKVTITKKWLEGRGACYRGMRAIASRLPLKISTDPEENYALACFLADDEHADVGSDARWLCLNLWCDEDAEYHGLTKYGRDAYQTAQWLAWAADAIDVKAKARKRR